MKKFILTSNKRRTEVFDSLEQVVNRLTEINKAEFGNQVWSLFGRGYDYDEEGAYIDRPWIVDSVCFKDPDKYLNRGLHTVFFIERIDFETGTLMDFES